MSSYKTKTNWIFFYFLIMTVVCGTAFGVDDTRFVGNGVCPANGGNYDWDNTYNWWDNWNGEYNTPYPTDDTRVERNTFDANCFAPDDYNCIIIREGMAALQIGKLISGWEAGETCFNMVNGYFNPGYMFMGGAGDANSTFTMFDGYLEVRNPYSPSNGSLILGEGQVNSAAYRGHGNFNLYDGNVDVAWILWLASPAEANSIDPNVGTRGVMNLYGGEVIVGGPMCINPCDAYNTAMPKPLPYGPGISGRINIEKGVLKFGGFSSIVGPSVVDYYVKDGRITAYGGHPRGEVHWMFDPNINPPNGKMVVWATFPDDLNTPWKPAPKDADSDQFRFSILSWSSGEDANQHDVYFGTSFNDVNVATVSVSLGVYKGRQSLAQTTYDPGMLALGETYYWRIDEINSTGKITRGPVWKFTVTDGYVLEHFEGYFGINDTNGVWNTAGGAGLSLDTSIYTVRSGVRTLLLDYNDILSPYYSEAVVTFPKAIDWTLDNCVALAVYFHGRETNAKDPLYVRVEDSLGHISPKVLYADVNDIAEDVWHPWNKQFNIALTSFTGVDITKIRKLYIGLGKATSAGGKGKIGIDDITLYPRRCVSPPMGDFDNDCNVNFTDYATFADDFRQAGFNVTPVMPPTGSLMVQYKFNETSGTNVADSSGNGRNGTVEGPFSPASFLWDTAGKIGGCIKLNVYGGSAIQCVKVPSSVWTSVANQATVAMWIKGDPTRQPPAPPTIDAPSYQYVFRFGGIDSTYSPTDVIDAQCPIYNGDIVFNAGSPLVGSDANDAVVWRPSSASAWEGVWNHYAFTKNATTGFVRIYLNGVLMKELAGSRDPIDDIDIGQYQVIGAGSQNLGTGYPANSPYKGRLDDFRVYNVELTQAQIASVMADAPGTTVHQPAPFTDINKDDVVDLKDLAGMALNWAETILFP